MMKRSVIIMASLLVLMLGPGVALAQPPGGPPGGGSATRWSARRWID
ncbi:MAG: hypothetical protein JRJ65_15760 [Deltaproteobacteria bacterium]|nr:hypothetical protein [Deltaproteobacteria bacterium]